MHDRVIIRRADNGFLTFRLRVEDMQFEGWTFPTQTQLFSLAADARSGLFIFSIYNAVLRHKAEVLDGISLTIQRVGGGSPVAGASIMERIGDLSGDTAADEATYETLAAADPLAPEGSISPQLQDHILPDVGPRAMAAGGTAMLTMPFAGSWSRGPQLDPRPPTRSADS